jgi:carbon storage regulator CsrA
VSNLTVTLKYRESVHVGDDISFTVVRQKGDQLSVCVSAPEDIKIRRQERFEKEKLEEEIIALEQLNIG